MLSSIRSITKTHFGKSKSVIFKPSNKSHIFYANFKRHMITIKRVHDKKIRNNYTSKFYIHHRTINLINDKTSNINTNQPSASKKLDHLKFKSFCSNSNEMTSNSQNPSENYEQKSRQAKYRFAVQFLYLPFFILVGATVIYRERVLTYFMQQIFKRRESFLKRCYPKRIILIRHGQSASNIDQLVLATVPDHEIRLTRMFHHIHHLLISLFVIVALFVHCYSFLITIKYKKIMDINKHWRQEDN